MDQPASPVLAPGPSLDMTMLRMPNTAKHEPQIQWRIFLQGLAEEIDSLAGVDERDDMLRGVGHRMSHMLPVAPARTLQMLENEINNALVSIGWGHAQLRVNEAEHALEIIHAGLPQLGPPPGDWLAALLGGLYDGWLAQQPGAQPTLHTRRIPSGNSAYITMRYSRP